MYRACLVALRQDKHPPGNACILKDVCEGSRPEERGSASHLVAKQHYFAADYGVFVQRIIKEAMCFSFSLEVGALFGAMCI